jgi:hypothetical protein
MLSDIGPIRNLGMAAHIGSGETALTDGPDEGQTRGRGRCDGSRSGQRTLFS